MSFDPQSFRSSVEQKHTAALQRKARELPQEAVTLARELFRDGVAIRTIHQALKEHGLSISAHKLSKIVRARRPRSKAGSDTSPVPSAPTPAAPVSTVTPRTEPEPTSKTTSLLDDLSKAVVLDQKKRGPQY